MLAPHPAQVKVRAFVREVRAADEVQQVVATDNLESELTVGLLSRQSATVSKSLTVAANQWMTVATGMTKGAGGEQRSEQSPHPGSQT